MSNTLAVINQSTSLIIPTDPDVRQKIKIAVQEISNSKTRIEAEKENIKSIVEDLSAQYQLPKAAINKMAALFHKQNIQEESSQFEDVVSLYETIFEMDNGEE